MLRTSISVPGLLVFLLAAVAAASAADRTSYGRVELLRDRWGIPHVFAESDLGAMYGLGYATAEDRGFQMTYSLRIIQGRLAELVGPLRQLQRNETAVDHDRKLRTFGFHRAARAVASHLDAETRFLLEAYSHGVNDCFQSQDYMGNSLFCRFSVQPEPWTPADCIASWWHLGQFFATDGTRDLIHARNLGAAPNPGRDAGLERGGAIRPLPPGVVPLPPDDAVAVVGEEDCSADWTRRVFAFAREHGLPLHSSGSDPGPRFSHAWVVGKSRSTTGSSVLVSDPQTPVRNPSLLYEFHICSPSGNARGVGVPGSPLLLIGFTDRVAWGATALGADQADLFRLRTDAEHPDEYWYDGRWREMEVLREEIRVKGSDPVILDVRLTHFGPVVTEFCFAAPGEGEVALKRVPICETEIETIQAAMAMIRAQDVASFADSLAKWRFPSVNFVFGDQRGSIGYWATGAMPIRSRRALDGGAAAHEGTTSDDDWQGIVPHDLLPHTIDPKRGYVASANHRPIGSWYPIPLGATTGSGGDTVRSWRLRELLEAQPQFAAEEVLGIHRDSVNPARREIVRLGLALRAAGQPLSDEARRALDRLQPWYEHGASSRRGEPGAELAGSLSTFFRITATELAQVYGGGESGLCYFLRSAAQREVVDFAAPLAEAERRFVDRSLAAAWTESVSRFGTDTSLWRQQAEGQLRATSMGYLESLDGFPTLAADLAVAVPALDNVDGGTIQSQRAQSYTQYVSLADPDGALSILPIGAAEHPESPARLSTYRLWAAGSLHPAPLSRQAVEAVAEMRRTLVE